MFSTNPYKYGYKVKDITAKHLPYLKQTDYMIDHVVNKTKWYGTIEALHFIDNITYNQITRIMKYKSQYKHQIPE